jgi:hypothetical protein
VKKREQHIAEQKKKYEIEAIQRDVAREQVPAALHSARRLVGRTTEKIEDLKDWVENKANFERFDAEDLRSEVIDEVEFVRQNALETQSRISLLNSIAKHFHESRMHDQTARPLSYRVYSYDGGTSIRNIILNAISLPLGLNEFELVNLNNDDAVAAYLKDATNFVWNVNLSGVNHIYANRECKDEKRADNIKGDWVKRGEQPFVNLTITMDGGGDIVCNVTNGPIPSVLKRTSGIGTMEIEWCVYGLSSFDFRNSDPKYRQGIAEKEQLWETRFIIPHWAIEEGRC